MVGSCVWKPGDRHATPRSWIASPVESLAVRGAGRAVWGPRPVAPWTDKSSRLGRGFADGLGDAGGSFLIFVTDRSPAARALWVMVSTRASESRTSGTNTFWERRCPQHCVGGQTWESFRSKQGRWCLEEWFWWPLGEQKQRDGQGWKDLGRGGRRVQQERQQWSSWRRGEGAAAAAAAATMMMMGMVSIDGQLQGQKRITSSGLEGTHY